MYAGIVTQQDFFLYVPLLRGREMDLFVASILDWPVEQRGDEKDVTPVELSSWTKIILPALTVYTYACGEEREFSLVQPGSR